MKTKRWMAFLSALLAVSFAFASCGESTEEPETPEENNPSEEVVTPTITMSETETALLVGETKTLTVSGASGIVTWLSSAPDVATVENGLVTGIAEGSAYITAKIGEAEATCRVIVAEQAVAVPTLVLDKISTEIGKGFSLNITPYVQIGMEFTKLDKTNVTWETSDSTVATVANGCVSGIKEGNATITAKYVHESETLTATATFNVVNINYHKAYVDGTEISSVNPVKVVVADEYLGTTSKSTATIQITEIDIATDEEKDVTQNIVWQSIDPTIATANGATVTGATKNGSTELIGTLDGREVIRVCIDGWTEITTKSQMDALSLATWKERADEEKVETVLNGKYVLGADIDYNGDYLLPIANTAPDLARMNGWPTGIFSYDSWVWEEILEPITPAAEWEALKFNTSDSTFGGSNPLNKPFTGVFDGNGYSISNAQILDVNHLYAYRGGAPQHFYAGGGCFIGTNEGIVENINFEELRYRRYHGESAADRDIDLQSRTIYCKQTNDYLPYNNRINETLNSALVRINNGVLSDIRISAYSTPAYSVWDNFDSEQTTAGAFGVCLNDALGEINNMVIVLKAGEIPHFAYDNDPQTYDRGSIVGAGTDKANYIFYAYNKGTITNSVFLSEVPEGASVQMQINRASTHWNSVNYIRHYGDDGQVGSLTGTTGSIGIIENVGAYFANATETCLETFNKSGMVMDSYAVNRWDTQTLTLKKGVWNV